VIPSLRVPERQATNDEAGAFQLWRRDGTHPRVERKARLFLPREQVEGVAVQLIEFFHPLTVVGLTRQG